MITWRFDPPQALSNEELTQILRDLFGMIPDEQKAGISFISPIIGQYLIQNDQVE